jgi:hypothetical protein
MSALFSPQGAIFSKQITVLFRFYYVSAVFFSLQM